MGPMDLPRRTGCSDGRFGCKLTEGAKDTHTLSLSLSLAKFINCGRSKDLVVANGGDSQTTTL